MVRSEWHQRIERAKELASEYQYCAEIMTFYQLVAGFQERFSQELRKRESPQAAKNNPFGEPLPREVTGKFKTLLSLIESNAPEPVKAAAQEMNENDREAQQILSLFWAGTHARAVGEGPRDFLARAFLQPYAEYLRSESTAGSAGELKFVCPICQRKPGVGVLRPRGDGGQRSLICSFCSAEWEFRRLICAGCGEEDHRNLPIYTAEEMKHVRVEACDTCRIYIKTVDLTKSGRSIPIVDEMAAMPLDLWARGHGYTKLQVNLMQM